MGYPIIAKRSPDRDSRKRSQTQSPAMGESFAGQSGVDFGVAPWPGGKPLGLAPYQAGEFFPVDFGKVDTIVEAHGFY
jgi:hypothetical protein